MPVDPQLEQGETVRQCSELMGMQADIYRKRRAAGRDNSYDMLLGDFQRDAAAEFRIIGRAMGICDAAANHPGLLKLLARMSEELTKNPTRDQGITRMHDVHTDAMREAKHCDVLADWMRTDPACAAWLQSGASPESNALLRGSDSHLPHHAASPAHHGKTAPAARPAEVGTCSAAQLERVPKDSAGELPAALA